MISLTLWLLHSQKTWQTDYREVYVAVAPDDDAKAAGSHQTLSGACVVRGAQSMPLRSFPVILSGVKV